MRVRFLGLWLPLVFACSGTNVVAGPELTEAERLEASLPTWCASTCQSMRACDDAECVCEGDTCNCGVDDRCEGNCQEVIIAAIRASDACAASAGRMRACYDAQGCGVFDGDRPCGEIENETMDCADYGADAQGPGPDGHSSGEAGSANLGPGPTGAGPSYASVVTCVGGFGGGRGVPEPGTTQVICEEGRFDCSDGHDYSMVCVATSTGQRACSCLVDEVVTGAFGPGEACPTPAEMNAGCGWRLAEM